MPARSPEERLTVGMCDAEVILRNWQALVCSKARPIDSLSVILRHSRPLA
jgi:hypothetical protein